MPSAYGQCQCPSALTWLWPAQSLPWPAQPSERKLGELKKLKELKELFWGVKDFWGVKEVKGVKDVSFAASLCTPGGNKKGKDYRL